MAVYEKARGEYPMNASVYRSTGIAVLGFMNRRNDLEAYTIEGAVDSAVVIHFFNAFCKTIAADFSVS